MASNLDDFVGEHDYPFSIALDTGETVWRYGVEGIPHYILIGRDNRIARDGESLESRHSPPTEEQIEALLRAGS